LASRPVQLAPAAAPASRAAVARRSAASDAWRHVQLPAETGGPIEREMLEQRPKGRGRPRSGKGTTPYSALAELNNVTTNISTAGDPG